MDENLSRGYLRLNRGRTVHDFRFRNSEKHISPPKDKYNAIYLALLLAGLGFLLPYNSFTIAVDYYQNSFPNSSIVYDMSLVYIVMAFFAVLGNNFLIETLSLNTRITFGYIISFFTLLFVAIWEIWLEAFTENTAYVINLLAVALVSLGCTVQQSSFYGYTSMLPSRYTQAVMAGESAAGFLVSLNRIITKSLLNDARVNTMIFFVLSVAIVALCFALHRLVNKTEFVQFYLSLCQDSKKVVLEFAEDDGLMDIRVNEAQQDPCGALKLQSSENSNNEYATGQYNSLSFANPAYEPQSTGPMFKVEEIILPAEARRPTAPHWKGVKSMEPIIFNTIEGFRLKANGYK